MTIRLAFTGDLMFGDHPVCLGHGIRAVVHRRGAAHLLAPARPILERADLAIGNLECVLTDLSDRATELQRLEMRGSPEVAQALRQAGFHAMSVANNHVLQHGEPAFRDTIAKLREAGLDVVGLNSGGRRSNVLERTMNGESVAVVAYSIRPERYSRAETFAYAHADETVIRAHIKELRSAYGTVVLCLHWGEEYMTDPSPAQVRLGRQLVDDGVTLLVGHHPHVLQGFERRAGSAILYSLGNFVFDKWRRFERETAIAEVEVQSGSVASVAMHPFLIDGGFVPRPLTGAKAQALLNEMNRMNERIAAEGQASDEEYAGRAESAYLQYRMASYAYFARNIYRYPPRVIGASLVRSIRRRLGLA